MPSILFIMLMNCEALYGETKYCIWVRLSLRNPLTSAGISFILIIMVKISVTLSLVTNREYVLLPYLDLSPKENLEMFCITFVTRSRLILLPDTPGDCLAADTSLSLSPSCSISSTSAVTALILAWHLSNSCSSPNIIPVTWVSSSASLSLSLL